jgi:hypothetical protein
MLQQLGTNGCFDAGQGLHLLSVSLFIQQRCNSAGVGLNFGFFASSIR